MSAGLAGMQIRVSIFQICWHIPVGFKVVPTGTTLDPYPCPSGFETAGTRTFCTSCHLEARGGGGGARELELEQQWRGAL